MFVQCHPKPGRTALLLALLALAPAAWALVAALRAGIVVGMDSLGYFAMSDSLLRNGTVATRHWPPGYPLLLSALRLLGTDRLAAAVVLNLAAFGLSALLAVAWLGRATAGRTAWTVAGAALILSSTAVLDVHRFAYSEAVFLVSGMASIFCTVVYLSAGRRRWLVGAALLAGAGVWFRYAGAFGALPVVVAPWLSTVDPRRRRRDAAWAILVLGAVLAAQGWGVAALAPEAGEVRSVVWHAPTLAHLRQWGVAAGGWFWPTRWVAGSLPLQVVAVAASVGVPLGAVVFLRQRNRIAAWFGFQALAYLAGLLLSVTLADHNTPLDARILLPYYVSLVGCLVAAGADLAAGRRGRFVLAAFLLAGAGCGARGVRYLAAVRDRDDGFNSAAWRTDPIFAWAGSVPEDVVLVSNAPGLLEFHAGRAAWSYPRKWDSTAARPADGLGNLRQAARIGGTGHIVLIHFPDWADDRDEPLERVLPALALDETARVGRAVAYGREPWPGAAGEYDAR